MKLSLRPDEQRVLELPLDPIPSKPTLWPWFVAGGALVVAGLIVLKYRCMFVNK